MGPGAMEGLFFVIWLVMMFGMIIGWIIVIIALWRGMKAHERIANALSALAQNVPGPGGGAYPGSIHNEASRQTPG